MNEAENLIKMGKHMLIIMLSLVVGLLLVIIYDYDKKLNYELNKELSYEKCLDKKLTGSMEEDIIQKFINDVDFCMIVFNLTYETRSDGLTTGHYEQNEYIEDCDAHVDWWSDNSTSITIVRDNGK